MKTDLNTIKDLILTIIRREEKPETLHSLIFEAERLPDAIRAHSLTVSTDNQVLDYIFWQQEILVNQANLLYKSCLISPRLIIKKSLVIILNTLKKLNHIFPKQFDCSLPLAQVDYLKKSIYYQDVLAQLINNFQTQHISQTLTEITLYPLNWFLNTKHPARYCDENFLSQYAKILLALNFNNPFSAPAEEMLAARLLTVNYNGLAFMDYLADKVKNDLKLAETKKEKELVLKKFKIWLKPIPVIINLAFDKNFPNLKDALVDWANLEEEALILLPDQSKRSKTADDRIRQKLDISVGILAYLTRLYKIHGLYPGRNHAQVVDHIVETFCTKQTTIISRDSFYNCYKAPTTGVARALRKLLRAILEDVDHFINTGEVRGHHIKTDQ